MIRRLAGPLALALLAGCGATEDGPAPDEARQLDEAAARMDVNAAAPAAAPETSVPDAGR